MGFFQKRNGAVTVFLVLILVPIIVITSIFVDVSKVQLAQSVVNSSGDLALNTLMSQYDTDLNEFYGLLASCQDVEQFYDTAGEFYETALLSKSLEGEALGDVAQQIVDMLRGDQETVDLLGITWEGDSAASISAVKNGNLANAAVMKKDIVEFMKYRSPINGTIDFLKKIKESKKAIEDGEKDAELIEKKEAYYEAESELMKTALEAYKKLKEYEEKGLSGDTVNGMKQYLDSLENEYKELDKKVIRDLYNTEGLTVFQVPAITVAPTVPAVFSESRKATASEIESLMKTYVERVRAYERARKDLESALTAIPSRSGAYDIQYWRACMEIIGQGNRYQTYASAANQLCQAYEKLKQAVTYAEENAMNEACTLPNYDESAAVGTDTLQAHWDGLDQQFDQFRRNYFKPSYQYYSIGNTIASISSSNIGNIDGSGADQKIREISTRLQGYRDEIESAISVLEGAETKVRDLKRYYADYQASKNGWSAQANSSDTDMAAEDRAEIERLSADNEIMRSLTREKIDELLDRIGQIKSLFSSYLEMIKSCKYNGTSIIEIDSLSKFKEKSGIDNGRISHVESELNGYVNEHSSAIQGAQVSETVNDSNNPDMKRVNTPSLYAWLMEHFKNYESNQSEYDEKKGEYDRYKAIKENKDDQVDTSSNSTNTNEISGVSPLPSAAYGASIAGTHTESAIQKVAEFTKSFCTDLGGTLLDLGVRARDDLYSLDYIMSMFSYDTYENEGKYSLCTDKDSVTAANYPQEYALVQDDWESEEVTDTYNKSLTNHMISSGNNWSYQNEVEYILYGGANQKNKEEAYARIFLLRYALNLPAEFTSYWNDSILDTLATGISAATYGVIPAALVKLAVILALTIMETGCDILYLKAGIPVLLVKGKGDLFVDFSMDGIEEKIDDNISDVAKSGKKSGNDGFKGLKIKFQYSDYLKVFLFLKLFNESSSYGIYARTADVVQANMRYQIVKDDGYSLEKSIAYFKLESNVRVKPLMLDLPLVRNETDNRVDVLKELDWCKIKYEGIRGY